MAIGPCGDRALQRRSEREGSNAQKYPALDRRASAIFSPRMLPAGSFVLALVTALAWASSAGGIWNGVQQSPEPGWAVRVDVGAAYCTATMIAPRWALTAAHCWEKTGPDPSATAAVVAGQPVAVDAVAQFPQWRAYYPDIALVHLAKPVPRVETVPLATADDMTYFTNQPVTVFGYGQLTSGQIPSLINNSPDGTWSLSSTCPPGFGGGYNCYRYLGTNLTGLVSAGDSGGAWVGWRDGRWHLLGVVSGYLGPGAWQGATSPASDAVAPWIAAMLAQPNPVAASRVDVNRDGVVNDDDLSVLLSEYRRRAPSPGFKAGDVNADGVVDALDLSVLLSAYGKPL
jgi:hypothetical protein